MRALWTAASGMKNLQLSIDTTANNLANVNTNSYKSQRTEFKDLLYERLAYKDNSDELGVPVNLEVGHGVQSAAITRSFQTGSFQATDNPLDVAIEGDGFFVVTDNKGQELLTRDGAFKLGLTENGTRLVTADGYIVKGEGGTDIPLDGEISEIKIDFDGTVKVRRQNDDASLFETVGKIEINQVTNPAGLMSVGDNFFKTTGASGEAFIPEVVDNKLMQNYLEMSNVHVVDEMVNMITAQRAYEINSKAIQTADQMLEVANSLKR